ncbi:hypothetical protein PPACK8108_LOCUS10574 [Phakopsora pachyrhizi]|uniref:Uncharacterized protein n=1 Tax=Phakopsora pachyrhizi TaxID=170000 RepID=A0AAV0B1Y1_PHAPC|nr:hypothetical protein PPACK8108_LOCUS10574 [Phakopsora pachyrhizi]
MERFNISTTSKLFHSSLCLNLGGKDVSHQIRHQAESISPSTPSSPATTSTAPESVTPEASALESLPASSSNPKKPSPSHPDDVLGTKTYSSPVAADSSDLTSNTSTTSNLKSHPLNQSPTVEKTSSNLNDNQLTPNSQTHSSNIRTIDSTKPSKPILELSLHDPITSDSKLGLDLDFLSFSQPPNHDLLAGLGPRLNSAVKQTQSTMVISNGLTPTGPRIIRASNSNINSSGRGYDGRQIVDSSAKISGSYRPSDSQRPPSQSSVASNRSTTPNLSQCSLRSNQELLPSSLPNSSSPSSASPPSESSSPPTSCDRHAAPKLASKTKVNQVKDSSPFLLDLDISGRGPSLAYGKISTSNPSEDEDGDEFYANPTMVKPNNSARQQTLLPSSKAPSRRDSAHDEDPYLSSSPTDEGSDDEEDAHSVQYDGSSSDHHHTYQSVSPSPSLSVNPSSAQSINGPYLSRSQRRAPSPAYSTGGLSMSSTTSGAIKKSINIFKPFQKTTTTQDSRNFRNNQHDIYPSPVSSSTSFNTSESKNSKSSLYKGSNRIVRLISRVTGQTQQPQPGIDPPRGAASSTNPSTKQTPRPQHIKRKASLSNLLDSITDTLTISNAKSSKVASPTDPVALREKSSMRKKSLELLMIKKPQRPNFHDSKPQQQGDLGSKEPNKPTSLETSDAENKKQPMLRGRRSFDMLRSKFRTGGRKSMDDLSVSDLEI